MSGERAEVAERIRKLEGLRERNLKHLDLVREHVAKGRALSGRAPATSDPGTKGMLAEGIAMDEQTLAEAEASDTLLAAALGSLKRKMEGMNG